jgi:hypothetical protein
MSLSKRQRVVKELIETERAYVASLRVLLTEYSQPLQKLVDFGEPIFSPQEMTQIFGQIPLILPLNEMLLTDLQAEGVDGDVGKVFQQFAPCLKMYHAYLDRAMDNLKIVMNKMKEKKGLASQFFENLLNEDSQTLQEFCQGKTETLESLIVKPVQRIPRYRMLVEELLKQMKKEGLDEKDAKFRSVKKSVALVSDAADHCNASIHQLERSMELVALYKRFGGQEKKLPPSAERRIIKELVLHKVSRRGSAKANVFVLFNDFLGYGRGSVGERVSFSRCIPLQFLRVAKMADGRVEVRSQSKSFIVQADSPAEAAEWHGTVEAAIAARVKELGGGGLGADAKVAPVWVPDTPECVQCGEPFSRFSRRRHHCRNCGQCVCADCSDHKWSLPHIKKKGKVRVCDPCYATLSGTGPVARKTSGGGLSSNPLARTHSHFMFDQDSEDDGDSDDAAYANDAERGRSDTTFQDDPSWAAAGIADDDDDIGVGGAPPPRPKRRHRAAPPPPKSAPRPFSKRVEAMYKRYNPAKLVDADFVPTLCRRYAGHEAALIRQLTHKYGAEPPFAGKDAEIGGDPRAKEVGSRPKPATPPPRRRSAPSVPPRQPSVDGSEAVPAVPSRRRRATAEPVRPARNASAHRNRALPPTPKSPGRALPPGPPPPAQTRRPLPSAPRGAARPLPEDQSPKVKAAAASARRREKEKKQEKKKNTHFAGADRHWGPGYRVKAVAGSKKGKTGRVMNFNTKKQRWLIDWGQHGERHYRADNLQPH